MLEVRKSQERGHANHGWLESYHSFSFAGYHDPKYMGFRALRVINENRVEPGRGFDAHSHRDMEILSFVLDGALEHKDNMGNGSVIRPGELQLMRAGTGVTHSEYNHSETEPVHFLQIWIIPDAEGLEPAYDQKAFPQEERSGRLKLLASPDGTDGSVQVHQDVSLYSAILGSGEVLSERLSEGRYAWVQVISGDLTVNGHAVSGGDGVAIAKEDEISLAASGPAEILLFELS